MRPLSAAPHQARCGQVGEEFPEYAIERRRDRAIRPIGRGVQRKRAPATRLSTVRLPISLCSGDGPANALRGKSPAIRNIPSPEKTADETGGVFPGEFTGECVSLETHSPWIPRGISRGFPGILSERPGNSPGNFLDAHPSSRGIPREISRAISPGQFPEFHGKPTGQLPGKFPGRVPGCRDSPGISRETDAASGKVGAGGG